MCPLLGCPHFLHSCALPLLLLVFVLDIGLDWSLSSNKVCSSASVDNQVKVK